MRYLVLALMLSSCTIKVEDSRLTREEVAKAFAERDANILAVAQKVAELVKEKEAK